MAVIGESDTRRINLDAAAPIIFIHYGPADYLRRTLHSAHRANPDKRIILLGDSSNQRFSRGVAEFVEFESLAGGEKERTFQKVFQVIQGKRHRFHKANGVEFWLKFVFRRWFLIEEFLLREGIDAFWTFDSDTLILAPLGPRESRFSEFSATSQCRGACLNGWVGSRQFVSRYTDAMLEQFQDPVFLQSRREYLATHSGLAFNEMDAFSEFRRRSRVKVWHAQRAVDGEVFDDSLAFTEDYEAAAEKVLNRTTVKRLWTNGKSLFARREVSGEFVRLVTCNMSWMPDYVWRQIMRFTQVDDLGKSGPPDISRLREINLQEPFCDQISRKVAVLFWRIRRLLPARISGS